MMSTWKRTVAASAAALESRDDTASTRDEQAEGDEARLRRAVLRHSGFLWRTLVRVGVPRADAEDALQEVFMVLARKLDVVPAESEQGFLLKVALGVASTRRRSLRRRPELLDPLDSERDGAPLPDQLLSRARLRQQLERLLNELSEDQRAVFVLIQLEGLSAPEAARLLDLPLGTVASRLGRGRRALLDAAERLGFARSWDELDHD